MKKGLKAGNTIQISEHDSALIIQSSIQGKKATTIEITPDNSKSEAIDDTISISQLTSRFVLVALPLCRGPQENCTPQTSSMFDGHQELPFLMLQSVAAHRAFDKEISPWSFYAEILGQPSHLNTNTP